MSISLREKYVMLLERASSPKSCDYSRSTIFSFRFYCRFCGAGMMQPPSHAMREIKKLFRKRMCSKQCYESGKRYLSTFTRNVKSQKLANRDNTTLDDMIAVSKQIDEQERSMPPFIKHLREVDSKFNYLSEKLSEMEYLTGERWNEGKYYYWLERSL